MSKLIAVWGTPQSGKTTFTVKLANALNLGGKGKSIHSAIAVFPDITTPVVPTVFPNKKDEELYSLGSVLQKPDLTRNLVVSNTIFVKDRSNLGFLGYTAKENRYSYAEYTRENRKLRISHFPLNSLQAVRLIPLRVKRMWTPRTVLSVMIFTTSASNSCLSVCL